MPQTSRSRRARCLLAVLAVGALCGPTRARADDTPARRPAAVVIPLPPQTIAPGRSTLALTVTVPPGHTLTDGAPLSYAIETTSSTLQVSPAHGQLNDPPQQLPLRLAVQADAFGKAAIDIHATVAYCTTSGTRLCKQQRLVAHQPLVVAEGGLVDWRVPLAVQPTTAHERAR